MTIIDEYSRESLAIVTEREIKFDDVLHCLTDLFVKHGNPDYIHSDNGPEFTAKVLKNWLGRIRVKTLFIEPGSPWENGYKQSFNGKLRDEVLNRKIFYVLKEAQLINEMWRQKHNTFRPHSSLCYLPPAPEAILPPEINIKPWFIGIRLEKHDTQRLT